MVLTYLGIDPGLDGALAVLTDGDPDTWDTPVVTIEVRRPIQKRRLVEGGPKTKVGQRRDYDEAAMWRLVNELHLIRRISFAVIEQVGTRPGESPTSAKKAGFGEGLWRMALVAAGIPFRVVHPASWKKTAGLSADKAAVRLEAQRRWPTASLNRVKDHGRSEALFLAEHARLCDARSVPDAVVDAGAL